MSHRAVKPTGYKSRGFSTVYFVEADSFRSTNRSCLPDAPLSSVSAGLQLRYVAFCSSELCVYLKEGFASALNAV